MPSLRKTLINLAGLGTTALVAVAAEHLGARHAVAEAAPAVGAVAAAAGFAIEKGSAFLHTFAEASFGHIGAAFFHDATGHLEHKDRARARENQDLHRMIGETIAHVLEQPAPTESATAWLKKAAQAFRSDAWMNIELEGAEEKISEPNIINFFAGDADVLKSTPVLTEAAWFALVEKVFAPTRTKESDHALHQAAARLHQHFAFQLWESAKHAWKQNDLAWPALILRLLTELLGNTKANTAPLAELGKEIAALREVVLKQAAPALANPRTSDKILVDAIHHYQSQLSEQLNRIETKLDAGFTNVLNRIDDVEAALLNPRLAAVKEPRIGLPNTHVEILARDLQAQALLTALRPVGPSIVSLAAPPGFGKSAVFALALRMLGEPPETHLRGIAVLNALNDPPSIATLSNLLGRITGYQEAAAKFAAATAAAPPNTPPDPRLRALFFDFLRLCGPLWLVVENAEAVLAPAAPTHTAAPFRDLLKDWCQRDHQSKLLLLTRNAVTPEPKGHHRLRTVEQDLLGGLPLPAALTLLRQRLEETRFHTAPEPLLTQIAENLHRVPMALEQFATNLRAREEGITLDQRFIDQNDLLRLDSIDQLPRIIRENLNLLDAPSLYLLRVVAWANMPVPLSGLQALEPDATVLTRLVRSNQLLPREGTIAEGRTYDMHALLREVLTEPAIEALDLARISDEFLEAGTAEWNQTQFRPALALYTLSERIERELGRRNDLAAALIGSGNALQYLGRPDEAVTAFDESIVLGRELVQKEGRRELRNNLAMALMNRGITLRNLGRLEEAVAAYDESISLRRELVEKEGRRELRHDLAMALMNRASALDDLGRLEEALAAYDESISLRRELVEKEGHRELRNDLGMALMNRANALQNLLRGEDAVVAYDESISLRRELVEKEGRRELRNGLAMVLMNRGVALRTLGRIDEAVMAYNESISLYRELVEKESRRELRNNLATVLMNQGNALRKLGRLEEAGAALDESISLRRELVEKEGRRDLRSDLAFARFNSALALDDQGNLPAAIEAAHEAHQLWEACVKDGMKHLEPRLARARALEAHLSGDDSLPPPPNANPVTPQPNKSFPTPSTTYRKSPSPPTSRLTPPPPPPDLLPISHTPFPPTTPTRSRPRKINVPQTPQPLSETPRPPTHPTPPILRS